MLDSIKKLASKLMDKKEADPREEFYAKLLDKKSDRIGKIKEKYANGGYIEEDHALEEKVDMLANGDKSDEDLEKEARLRYIRECTKRS